ncbi:MAG TPA: PhnD/SsuA/transferrin family substrate-binding protein [Candidatus Polarisedimenticolia bacterium]|nr:PhnD/SsuA/transferrin family substrate-binding protein [Candidatus Polarisedimenticolia bacterium]
MSTLLLVACLVHAAAVSALEAASLVFCSPGSPGDTAQAGPTMEQLARALEKTGGLPAGSVSAAYYESEATGVAALRATGTLLAAVPIPFFVAHEKDLGLDPRLSIVAASGEPERFALVAHMGSVTTPADLAGWEIAGTPGYAEGFVRRAFVKGFGALPDGARVTFNAAPLQALRRAATGDKLAVVLDAAATASLGSLPFGADLAVVARSEPLPAGLVCTLNKSSGGKAGAAILKGLERLPKSAEGQEALAAIRVQRFDPIDAAAVARLKTAAGQESGGRP